jgi:heat shock protein HtpX
MVTLTLIQGVVNTFVIFLSRAAAYAVDNFLRQNDRESRGSGGLSYMLASIVVMYFSQQREYRADAGAAELLGGMPSSDLPKEIAASGISGNSMKAIFSTHPPLADRIAALE